ncbi:MAG: hypothetical protein K6D59_11140 [Bacteroidales bacterium]|nr:hypothetical protein [Bacteroidales bacterium]
MSKRLIYLQRDFWESIKSSFSVSDRKLFWSLYEALENSNLRSDIPDEYWEEDDLLYYLLQSSADGSGVIIERNVPQKINEALDATKEQPIENLSAVYLLSENTMLCEGHGMEMGILCLNVDMLRKRSEFVNGCAVMYDKDEKVSTAYEKCEKQLSIPCNSAIIIDPYILSTIYSIDNNLVPLLKYILPKSKLRTERFHLSIFSQTKNCFVGKNRQPIYDEDIYQYILKRIHEIQPELDLMFELYHIKTTGNGDGDFHSRHIITNCMIINSEDGFDIFKREKDGTCCSGKNARIEFLNPTLVGTSRKDAENFYRWIKVCSTQEERINSTYIEKNRLFKLK